MLTKLVAVLGALLLVPVFVAPAGAQSTTSGDPLYLLTSDDRLLLVRSDAPSQLLAELRLAAPAGAERPDLLDVDVRAATGELYGLGADGRLYVIDESTGEVRPRGESGVGPLGGLAVGFDVDPDGGGAVVVVEDGRSFLVNPDTGVATASTAPYAAGDAGAGSVPRLVAVAVTSQRQFAVDAQRDALISRPRAGGPWTTVNQTLTRPGTEGIDVADAGFEVILPRHIGYAVVNGLLYELEPATGFANRRGELTTGSQPARIDGLTTARPAVVVQPFEVPEGGSATVELRRFGDATGTDEVEHDLYSGPGDTAGVNSDVTNVVGRATFAPGVRSRTLQVTAPDDRDTEGSERSGLYLRSTVYEKVRVVGRQFLVRDNEPGRALGLTTDDRLVGIDLNRPSVDGTPVPVTGLPAGTALVGLDLRPSTRQVLAVGSDSRLYRLDTDSGRATDIGALGVALDGAAFGVDVDPWRDRVRIASDTGQHLLVDPDSPAGEGTRVLPPLRYGANEPDAGRTPDISALSHRANRDTNDAINGARWHGLTRTGRAVEGMPDDTVRAHRSLGVGLDGALVDTTHMGYEFAPSGGAAFAVVRTDAGPDARLYRMDGEALYATQLGTLAVPGGGGAVEDLTVTDLVAARPASPSPQPGPQQPSSSVPSSPAESPSAAPSIPLDITVSPMIVTPGQAARVTVTGQPGTVVELHAYSRPSTTYSVVRRAVMPGTGSVDFLVTPGTNTRLYAAGADGTVPPSSSVALGVQTALSLSVVRHGTRDYTFQGRILPRRAGQLITLYRIEPSGRSTISAQLRTDDTGTYRFRRVFTGSGTYGFLARTGATLTNAAGASDGGSPKTVRIF